MILFTRTLTVLGNPRETGGWARGMAKLVTEKTGKETALWAGLSGTRTGTLIFSAFYENMADFATATETLMADEQYLDGVTEAHKHLVGPPEDRHVEIVHTAGGEYRRPGLGGVGTIDHRDPRPGQACSRHWLGASRSPNWCPRSSASRSSSGTRWRGRSASSPGSVPARTPAPGTAPRLR